MGCEEQFDRLEEVIRKLVENWVYMAKADHECEVHGDKGMCDEYEIAHESVKEHERELSKVLGDLNRCIQRR
jgi:hypothetical protein